MTKMNKIRAAFLTAILIACSVFGGTPPKYIFLFIGDGMAEPDVVAAESYLKDSQIQNGVKPEDVEGLTMTASPVEGKVSTFSKDKKTTDSAASATAFSTGFKTDNGFINIDKATGRFYEPMLKFAKRHGFKVGIVSSSAPNHATPAGFYAAAESRYHYLNIARQMAQSDVDYIGGPYAMGVDSKEDNIKELAIANGFTIASSREEFGQLAPSTGKVWAYSPMPYVIDQKHDISLAAHTQKAVELLENPGGFFIMVEGAQIDWASHANDAAAMIYEVIAFDEAIEQAVEFYHQHPAETLIIVTSDHECGGLSLDTGKVTADGMSKIIQAQKGSRDASAKVFSEIKRQNFNFDQSLALMKDYFGIDSLTEQELKDVKRAFSTGGEKKGDFSYGDAKKLSLVWVRIVSNRAGLLWSSLSHTDADVPLYALGAEAEMFGGNSDNGLISWYIRDLIIQRASQNDN